MTAHCDFPACPEPPEPNGMCLDHARVRVSASYLADAHSKSSGE